MYHGPIIQHHPYYPKFPIHSYNAYTPTGVNHANTLGYFRPFNHEKSIPFEINANPIRYTNDHPASNSNVVRSSFSKEEAAAIALLLGIDFRESKFDLNEFWMGVNIELEHGRQSNQTNVTDDNPLITGKIALAHLNEFPDYYKRLKVLEEEAKAYWNK